MCGQFGGDLCPPFSLPEWIGQNKHKRNLAFCGLDGHPATKPTRNLKPTSIRLRPLETRRRNKHSSDKILLKPTRENNTNNMFPKNKKKPLKQMEAMKTDGWEPIFGQFQPESLTPISLGAVVVPAGHLRRSELIAQTALPQPPRVPPAGQENKDVFFRILFHIYPKYQIVLGEASVLEELF